MTPLRLDAPAKLNLWLGITGRRPDGFHTLVSEMVLLELADGVLLMPGCSGLRVDGPAREGVPPGPGENLAWRGLLEGLGAEDELACLTLEKRIPVAAGLGGGSSDAVAAWRLGRRWRGLADEPDEGALAALAGIGADLPFFAARAAAAVVSGVGEKVEPRPTPPDGEEVVLVHPPFALPTAAVFAELRPADWSGRQPDEGGNDLLAPARRLRPELDDVFRWVAGAGARPQLTGSGPTVFARTDDAERADGVARRLGRAGLRCSRTRLRREAASIEALDDEAEDG